MAAAGHCDRGYGLVLAPAVGPPQSTGPPAGRAGRGLAPSDSAPACSSPAEALPETSAQPRSWDSGPPLPTQEVGAPAGPMAAICLQTKICLKSQWASLVGFSFIGN